MTEEQFVDVVTEVTHGCTFMDEWMLQCQLSRHTEDKTAEMGIE